jgi:arginine exporter protein ArgO
MRSRVAAVAALAVAGVALTPATALAGTPTTAKAPRPPASGTWTVTSFNPQVSLLTGSLVVAASHKKAHGTKVTVGAGTPPACGQGTIKVLGAQKIVLRHGVNEGGAFKLWAVGTISDAPAAFAGVKGVKVTLSRAGQQFPGTLSIAFSTPRGGASDDGQIAFKGAGATCTLQFTAKR